MHTLLLLLAVFSFAAAAGLSISCQDELPGCEMYSMTACQDVTWGRLYCARYCNLCDHMDVAVTTKEPVLKTSSEPLTKTTQNLPSICYDAIPGCDTYSKAACSDIFWGRTFCAHYCDLCDHTATFQTTYRHVETSSTPFVPPTLATTAAPVRTTRLDLICDDAIPDCSAYSKSACQNIEWGKTYCANYCELCDVTLTRVPTIGKIETSADTSAATSTARPSCLPGTFPPRVHTSRDLPVSCLDAYLRLQTTRKLPVTCQDALPGCDAYSKTACQNKDWGKTYCARYCELCDLNTPASTHGGIGHGTTSVRAPPSTIQTTRVTNLCSDVLPLCNTYSKAACEDKTWGKLYCANFCDLCDETATTKVHDTPPPLVHQSKATSSLAVTTTTTRNPSSSCHDGIYFCDLYSQDNCKDIGWALAYCASYCKLC